MRELIRHILKEEAYIKVSGDKYSKLIKRVVLDYVDFDICGLSVSQLLDVKDQYIVIIITEKQLKTSYREELQDYLNSIIPLTTYVSIADGMDCRNYRDGSHSTKLSESKIPTQVLRRHHLIDEMFEHIRSRYNFCNHRTPAYLVNNLYEKTLEDLYHAWFYQIVSDDEWDVASEYIGQYLKEKYQDETIDQWWKECGKRKLNESNNKLQQELKQVIKDSNIFDAADMVGGVKNLKRIFKDDPEMSSLFEKLTGTITFHYPLGGEDDIEFPLKYEIINRHSNIYKTNHWPDINVFYNENKLDPEENDTFKQMIKYLVDEAQHSGFISKFEDSRLFNVNYLTVKEINGEDIDSIDEVISFDQEDVEYLLNKLYGSNRSLNESSIKEKSLIKLIEKDGLYDIIEMTGLDFNQVKSLLNQMDNPKEVLKQYIREFVLEHDGMSGENYGSIFALNLPLSDTKYLNDILVQDRDQIAVEILEYELDEYGDREQDEQYLTSINTLTNEELLSIISWMMETIKGGYWD